MPTAPIDVDTDVYTTAAGVFLSVNDSLVDAVGAVSTCAAGGGGMAGTDSSGADWAEGYDAVAADALRTGADLASAVGHLGELLQTTADNHAGAEAASVPNGPPAYPGSGTGIRGATSVIPAAPPSADGTPGDPPAGWWLIAHVMALTWPNGHQDQLRSVGQGWVDAADTLQGCADRLTAPIGDISALRSPEVDSAVATCTSVQLAARTLAENYRQIGLHCAAYADHLDQAHHEVIDELVELLWQEALFQSIGAAVAVPTAGASEVAAQTASAARITAAAGRIALVLRRLAGVVKAVAEALRTALTAIRDVAKTVRVVLEKGVTRALRSIAPQARSDWRELSRILYECARDKGMFGGWRVNREQADALGMAWVGDGARLSKDGTAWISRDGLRQYRPPELKKGRNVIQANIERREVPSGKWQHNGHLDISD